MWGGRACRSGVRGAGAMVSAWLRRAVVDAVFCRRWVLAASQVARARRRLLGELSRYSWCSCTLELFFWLFCGVCICGKTTVEFFARRTMHSEVRPVKHHAVLRDTQGGNSLQPVLATQCAPTWYAQEVVRAAGHRIYRAKRAVHFRHYGCNSVCGILWWNSWESRQTRGLFGLRKRCGMLVRTVASFLSGWPPCAHLVERKRRIMAFYSSYFRAGCWNTMACSRWMARSCALKCPAARLTPSGRSLHSHRGGDVCVCVCVCV